MPLDVNNAEKTFGDKVTNFDELFKSSRLLIIFSVFLLPDTLVNNCVSGDAGILLEKWLLQHYR